MLLGQKIKNSIDQTGIDPSRVAAFLNLSTADLNRIFKLDSIETKYLVKIGQFLGIRTTYFLEDIDSEMDKLNINTNINTELLKEIGVLMFPEFPATVLFSDQNNRPIVREWIDYDESKKEDVFFYYKTSVALIDNFLNRKISHLYLMENSLDGCYYFQYLKEGNSNAEITEVININKLKERYKIAPDYYFNENNTDGMEAIKKFLLLPSTVKAVIG